MFLIHDNRIYEVVEAAPAGFFVWNIGRHNAPAGFVPICERLEGGGKYEINTGSLKAIQHNQADVILQAASHGATTPAEALRLLRNFERAKSTAYRRRAAAHIRAALPFLKELFNAEL